MDIQIKFNQYLLFKHSNIRYIYTDGQTNKALLVDTHISKNE